MAPQRRRAIYWATAKALASLHSVDVNAIGLGKYGRMDNYCKRQVHEFSLDFIISDTCCALYLQRFSNIVLKVGEETERGPDDMLTVCAMLILDREVGSTIYHLN